MHSKWSLRDYLVIRIETSCENWIKSLLSELNDQVSLGRVENSVTPAGIHGSLFLCSTVNVTQLAIGSVAIVLQILRVDIWLIHFIL